MSRRLWRRAATALVVCSAAAAAPVFAQEEPERIVSELRISGNAAFSDRELRRAIFTEASECKSFFLKPFCAFGAFRDRRVFDPLEFQLDVARLKVFYWRRGYREMQVDTVVDRRNGDVAVRFRIEEGKPVRVRSLALAGLEGIVEDTAAQRRRLTLRVGDAFSVLEVEAARSQVEQFLRNRGYAHAQVLLDAFLPSDDPYAADVSFRVEPGPRTRIGAIHVLGIERVEPNVVRRLLTFRAGDLYREGEILRSQRKLYSVALFQYADVTPQLEGGDSIVDVWVRVSEGNVHAVREGIGLSNTECLQIQASWTHRSFLGSARRLDVSGSLSNLLTPQLAGDFPCRESGNSQDRESPFNRPNWIGRVDFQQPWFISSRNVLGLGVFAERQSLPTIFVRRSYGGDATLDRQLGSRTTLTLTYRAERDELDAGSASLFFCGNFGFCLPQDVQLLARPHSLSWVSLGLFRDQTDAVFSPSRGYVARVEFEHASRFTISDYAYNRAWADFSVYTPFADGVLAARLRPGWVRPIGRGLELDETVRAGGPGVVHPFKRLYAGGANTIRGFGQNLTGPLLLFLPVADTARIGCSKQDIDDESGVWRNCDANELEAGAFQPRPLGGTVAVVGNVELRFPLAGERWSGALFVDWGGVWQDDEEFRRSVERGLFRDLVWTPGLGIRYLSPVGPVRVDLGYNTTGPRTFPVVTEPDSTRIVQLEVPYRYDPFSDRSGFREFLNRLQVHFSLGQAF